MGAQTTKQYTNKDVAALNDRFADATAEEVVRWALDEFGRDAALACSFGPEDTALAAMLARVDNEKARIFSLDTGRLHEETYEIMDSLRNRLGVAIEIYFPRSDAVEAMVREKGPFSFYDSIENRKECCGIRKVEPLKRALSGLRAWFTGLRREQAVTRTDTARFELDELHGGILKINPLVDWTFDEVMEYHEANNVPIHPLIKQGYPSIGCQPCTRAIEPGEDNRAGRWWWENPDSKECGLHTVKTD